MGLAGLVVFAMPNGSGAGRIACAIWGWERVVFCGAHSARGGYWCVCQKAKTGGRECGEGERLGCWEERRDQGQGEGGRGVFKGGRQMTRTKQTAGEDGNWGI